MSKYLLFLFFSFHALCRTFFFLFVLRLMSGSFLFLFFFSFNLLLVFGIESFILSILSFVLGALHWHFFFPAPEVPHFFLSLELSFFFLSIISFSLGPCVNILLAFGVEFFSFFHRFLRFLSLLPSPGLVVQNWFLIVLGHFLDRVDPDSKPCDDRHALASGTK